MPVAGSKSVAPTDDLRVEGPKKSWSECGSTPDFASVIFAMLQATYTGLFSPVV